MFSAVVDFEKAVANFFGAPYAVATDCCTHAIELCLRYKHIRTISVPKQTYLSVPMLAMKLNINLSWVNSRWCDYYYLAGNIYDAAVLWEKDSYISDSYMCISFQHSKHLSLDRGGIILCSTLEDYNVLKAMSYDGRDLSIVPWAKQDVSTVGYHYYMTPESAQLGLMKLPEAIAAKPKKWTYADYPDVSRMGVFRDY